MNLLITELADEDLGEDDVFILESIAEAKKNAEDKLRVTLILTLKDSLASLAKIIRIIEVRNWQKLLMGHAMSPTCMSKNRLLREKLPTFSAAFESLLFTFCTRVDEIVLKMKILTRLKMHSVLYPREPRLLIQT
jgi:hypothetical protein